MQVMMIVPYPNIMAVQPTPLTYWEILYYRGFWQDLIKAKTRQFLAKCMEEGGLNSHEDWFTVYSSCGSPSHCEGARLVQCSACEVLVEIERHRWNTQVSILGGSRKVILWWFHLHLWNSTQDTQFCLGRKQKCVLRIIIFCPISKSVTVASRKVWNTQIGFTNRPAWFPTRPLKRTYWSTKIASNNPAVIHVCFAGPAIPFHPYWAKVSTSPDTLQSLHAGGFL